jgi:carbamoyl-phosphate synthase large subunit
MEKNILITSAGRRVSLVRIFKQELLKKFPGSKIIAADSNPQLSAACKVADVSEKVPAADQMEYMQSMLHLCEKHSVTMLIPTIDTELQILSENKNRFFEAGVSCIVSDAQFISVCRNKKNVLQFFTEKNIPVPQEYEKNKLHFPLIAKPVTGSASKNIFIAHTSKELPEHILENEHFIFLQYLNPRQFTEFTADMYYDKTNTLQCIVPRQRIEVRDGEVSKAVTVKNKLAAYLSEKLNVIEGAQGVLNIQVFYNETEDIVFASEINPRFGGGYPLSYYAGANFPAMLINEYLLGKKISFFDEWKENVTMLRYDDEIFSEKQD